MRKLSFKPFLAIAFLVLIWGLSWSIYKMTLEYTPPILFAGMRSFFGGLLLAIFILPTWRKIKWRENWTKYCLSALLNAVLFFGIQTVGLIYLPGGLFSVLVYLQPVLIGLFAWIWLGESMTRIKILGLIVGFIGIIAVSADGLAGKVSIIGVVLALSAAVSWALGTIYVKKENGNIDSMWMVSFQFMIGGFVLLVIGSGWENWSDIIWNGQYFTGLGYGATLGIPISFVLYFKLMNSGESSKIAAFTFLVPLIAVLTGTVFMNEPFTWTLFVGLILIVISIYLVNYTKDIKKPNLVGNSVKHHHS